MVAVPIRQREVAHLLTGVGVHEPTDLFVARCVAADASAAGEGDLLAVGRDGDAVNVDRAGADLAQHPAGTRLPEAQGEVAADREEGLAVGREVQAVHRPVAAAEADGSQARRHTIG